MGSLLENKNAIIYGASEGIGGFARTFGCVTPAALVVVGGASPAWMIDIGKQIAAALPNGRHGFLEGQGHVVDPGALVPVLAGLFAD